MAILGGKNFDVVEQGRHPYTNETIIPEEVVEHVAYGRPYRSGNPNIRNW